MNAIFASKIYQNSTRKEAISAALANPINQALVQQLQSYLDDDIDDITPPDDHEESESSKSVSKHPHKSVKDKNTEAEQKQELNKHFSSPSGHANFGPGPEKSEEPSMDEFSELPEENNEEVETSTFIAASDDAEELPMNDILGILRANEDTALVERAAIKDDKELWLFYNDSVNLNDIMNSVIELLNASGYTKLTFNRLARSDNAIVFVIEQFSNTIQPTITDVDEIGGVEEIVKEE